VKDVVGRVEGKRWEETMPETPWDRRELLKAISAGAATGFLAGAARDAAAQQIKWSEGTEPPKLKAPLNACDYHHHIYDARYPVDPKAVLRPGDALVDHLRRRGPGRREVEADAARALPVHVFQLGIRERVVDDHDGARLRSECRDGVQGDPVIDTIGRRRHDDIAAGAIRF
jgi:hypothetical protein